MCVCVCVCVKYVLLMMHCLPQNCITVTIGQAVLVKMLCGMREDVISLHV